MHHLHNQSLQHGDIAGGGAVFYAYGAAQLVQTTQQDAAGLGITLGYHLGKSLLKQVFTHLLGHSLLPHLRIVQLDTKRDAL